MSKYVDIPAIMQVIGTVYNSPSLLDEKDKYTFNEEDFTEEFHKVVFEALYNLYALGVKEITLNSIEDYFEQRPKKMGIYKANKGPEYIQKASESAQLAAFDYYYNRMKKMSLFRAYQQVGMDLKWLYDIDNILDVKKKQAQEDWLDNHSIIEIADLIDRKISDVRLTYADGASGEAYNAGDGALELIERLQKIPEVGYPMFGPLVNAVTRGARLKKFYLRSAATGVGKTRSMIADACYIACDEIYNIHTNKWEKNNTKEPALYITTEQELEEIQTMMLAFLSGVNEEHIINGKYKTGELDRVKKAAKIMKESPLYIEELPDFSLQDVENTIKRNIRDHETRYIFFDYIHTSMKILSEISSKAGIKGLREDNILFMLSTKLKDICNQQGVFILTSTQLNAEYRTAEQYDQNLLRGAKSIADRIDLGMIMLEVSSDDLTALSEVIAKGGYEQPTVKISVYKNRRGRYKDILLWCKADRGTCRIEPMFATKYDYELVHINDIKISIKPQTKPEASAF